MKIVLITYYDFIDSIKYAGKSLKKQNIEISSFPLYKYQMDKYDKKDNYDLMLIEYIQKETPDYILWWYFNIPTSMFINICKSNSCKNILFNWDEPYNWNLCDIHNKASFFDYIFICSEEKYGDYKKLGAKNIFHLLPGYSSSVHNLIINDSEKDIYECDISICCTNLYENNEIYPNQYINRKKLIDDIYANQNKYNYIFYIYGPSFLGDIYPLSYRGLTSYEDTNKIFNYSKINISTHVQQNAYKYLNERSINILGSSGLLYVDKIKGIENILNIDEDCVIIDRINYLEQINDILKNYDKYHMIRANGYKKSMNYTWDKWAQNIIKELS